MYEGRATLAEIRSLAARKDKISRREKTITAVLVLGSGFNKELITGLKRRFFNGKFDVKILKQGRNQKSLVRTKDGFFVPKPEIARRYAYVDTVVMSEDGQSVKYLNLEGDEVAELLRKQS